MDNERCELIIMETSDLHGNVFPINYRDNEEVNAGLAKIAALIKSERENNQYSLLIDNGDFIQGTPSTYYYAKFLPEKINPLISLLNDLNYDCAVIGNHEFNYGSELLQAAVDESQFPWLSANILREGTKESAFGPPYIVKEFENGLRVAVLGITTHYIPNWENPRHIVGLQFEDALASAKRWVNFIQKHEQYDLLVVSYHGGFERDLSNGEPGEAMTGENQAYAICHEIEGIDILLTGHQHRMIADTLNGVTVVQPGYNGQALGKVKAFFEKIEGKWVFKSCSSQLIEVDHSVQADPHILKMTEEYEKDTQIWLDQPIAKIIGDMTISSALELRLGDHPLIEFLNYVQMDASGARISSTALFDNRSRGFQEQVTMRDIVSNYIYPNTLKVIRITGQDMKDALEISASYFMLGKDGEIQVNPAFAEPKPQHYNYDMWEGIEYEFDIRNPIGERVVKLSIKGDPVQIKGEYDVVMNNYRAGGGGNYNMFKDKPVIKEIQTDMTELIANYMMKRKKIYASCDHNWKVVW
ncbi:bifunctional metallophosphatase/5'-nucleotidase [Bacillus sp. JJ1503]|uniref:bifunctional metallophosphatase/5'-nucleotidase n=1 Tax=Bacillus sp. JJ1503 TaxID=3122956 RepID=UPI0030008F3E